MKDLFDMKAFNLEGKTALVTGGNMGIGRALGEALAVAGADVFVSSYSTDNVEEITKDFKAIGRRFEFMQADLTKEDECEKTVKTCIEKMGKVDILVNNAGNIYRAPILEGDNARWRAIIDLNMSAVYYISKETAKFMVTKKSGKIINIASMLSFQGGKFVPSYTASKHGVAGLTKAFANELGADGIQTNAIAPGYFETANTAPIRADAVREKEILGRIPAGRWGQVSDLQGTAVFLASRAADYINGHILAVDGGWLVR